MQLIWWGVRHQMFVSRNACFFSQVSAASTAAMALTDSDADAPLSDSGGFLVIHS